MQQDDNVDLPPVYTGQQTQGSVPQINPVQPGDTGIPPALAQMIAELPQEANDIDLIEKEWILKSKQIVAHTINDPYHQQAAISQMKAEYMKKRYNKDVKGA